MAELVFYYGAMGGRKTTTLILDEADATRQKKKCIIIKPILDTRDGEVNGWGKIKSRVLESEHQALYVDRINAEDYVLFDNIYVDEIQFFKKEDIIALSDLVDKHGKNVYCYGLKTAASGELFEASAQLLAMADRCVELPVQCICGRVATQHVRYIDDKVALNQSGVEVEQGKVTYKSVCRSCWKEILGR